MKSKIINYFLAYSFGAIVLRCITASISFLSISFLSSSEYGLLSLINTFIYIAPIFFNLGLRQAFGIEFFHVNSDLRKKMLNDVIGIYLIISIPLLIISIINLSFIKKLIFFNQVSENILFLSLGICFIHFFTELLFQVFRYQSKALQLSITQMIMGIFNLFFALIFVYFANLKIYGIIAANFCSMLIIAFYGLYLYIKKIKFFNFNLIKKNHIYYYLKLGFPFIPNILFTWLLSFGNRWILAHYLTLHEVGIYSLADSFGQLFQMVILYPLSGSYLPYIFQKFSEDKENILKLDAWNRKNMILCMLGFFILITISFFAFKSLFYCIFPIKFHESINYIWLILIGQVLFMGSYFATCYLVFLKKTYFLMCFTIFSSSFCTILNLILVPKFFLYGCVIANLISYTIYLVSIIYVTKSLQKYHNQNMARLTQETLNY